MSSQGLLQKPVGVDREALAAVTATVLVQSLPEPRDQSKQQAQQERAATHAPLVLSRPECHQTQGRERLGGLMKELQVMEVKWLREND